MACFARCLVLFLGGVMISSNAVEEEIANQILLALPQMSLKRLRPALECRTMVAGDVIAHVDRPIEHLHFVNRGLISFVKNMEDGRSVEIGVVGIEGISSPHTLFGMNRAILDAVVQIPGTTFRIKRDKLHDMMDHDDAIHEILERYANFSVAAYAQTAACNRLHHIEERVCRWLLIAHDSARSETFPMTHEFLAMMLGVQRAGVSMAASNLQKAGWIHYRHGQVTIANRSGLEKAACECYRVMTSEYEKIVRRRK